MKHFLITLLLCASSLHAQNPLKGEWITSSLLRDFKEGYQNLLVLTRKEGENFGYASVSGTFQLIAPSYVRLNALTFEQTGDCKHKNEKLHNDTADYYIYKVSNKKIFLVKSTSKNEKEDQEKAKNYLLVTGIKDDVVYKQKTKMKVEAKEIGALPAQVEKYATDILQLKKFKILIYNQLRGRAAWVFAVKDLTTGTITYVIQENYYDAKDKEISRFFDCTEAEIKKFRQ